MKNIQIGQDGEDFINIYSRGITPLGRFLSNFTSVDDVIQTEVGNFKSIEGLIFYLGSFDSKLRKLSGFEAKRYGESADRGIRLPEDIFRNIIIEAMENKLFSAKFDIFDTFLKSTLPFVHYYEYNNKRIEPKKWLWQIEEWEKLRTAIKKQY